MTLDDLARLMGMREAAASVALDGETQHVAEADGSCCWEHAMAKIAELEDANTRMRQRDDDLRDELHECCANLREYEAEITRLRARNAELVAVLREVEWSGVRKEDGETICPTCLWLKDDGHAPDCALDAALRGEQ